MIRAVVCGAAGRMGCALIRIIHQTGGMTLTGALERPDSPLLGEDAGLPAGLGPLGVVIEGDPAAALAHGADVLIDFTAPDPTIEHLKLCARAKVAAVVGTTGLSSAEKKVLAEKAHAIPVVFSPNFSLGVNVLFKLAELAARTLGPAYDAEIVEAHHNRKKDAPSGTALRLAEAVAGATSRDLGKVAVYGRQGMVGERRPDEIGIQSVRAGDIVGDHTLILAGPNERLELVHRAHSRENFAQGAVKAAQWVAGRKPGLYDMGDVLGLKG